MQPELLEDHLRAHPEGTPLGVIAREILKLSGPPAVIERIAESALAATNGVIRGADGLYRWDLDVSVAAQTRAADQAWLERARAAKVAESRADAAAAAAAAELARNMTEIDAVTGESRPVELEHEALGAPDLVDVPETPTSSPDAALEGADFDAGTSHSGTSDDGTSSKPRGAEADVRTYRVEPNAPDDEVDADAWREHERRSLERLRREDGRRAEARLERDDRRATRPAAPVDEAEAEFVAQLMAPEPASPEPVPEPDSFASADEPDRVVVLVAKATDRHPSTGALVEVGAVEIEDGQITTRRVATAVRPPRPLPEPLLNRLGLDAETLAQAADLDETLAELAPMLDGARVVCLGSDRGAAFLELALRDAGLPVSFDGDVVLLWPVLRAAGLVEGRVDLEAAAGALDVILPAHLDTGALVDFMAELVLAAVDRGVAVARLQPRPGFDFSTVAFDRDTLAALPEAPGVYRFLDRAGHTIYVGKAKRLRQRVASYFGHRAQRRKRYAALIADLYDVRVSETGTELEALLEELRAIRTERPRYNVQLAVGARSTEALEGSSVIILPGEGEAIDRAALIFVGGGALIGHIHARRDGGDLPRVREALRRAFWTDRPGAADAAESALVASWVARHRSEHSTLDIAATGSLDEAVRLVEAYVRDPDLGHEALHHR